MTDHLTRFLVELEQPELRLGDIESLAARSRSAADELRAEGAPVRFLRTIYSPQDGRCYLLFEGPSREQVSQALERGRIAGEVSAAVAARPVEPGGGEKR